MERLFEIVILALACPWILPIYIREERDDTATP